MTIYFVQAGEGGPIKIGQSEKPEKRIRELAIGVPHQLLPLGILDGGSGDEADLHVQFAAAHVMGEWFSPVPEILDFIKEKAKPFPRHLKGKRSNVRRRDVRSLYVPIDSRIYDDFAAVIETESGSVQDAVQEAISDYCNRKRTTAEIIQSCFNIRDDHVITT